MIYRPRGIVDADTYRIRAKCGPKKSTGTRPLFLDSGRVTSLRGIDSVSVARDHWPLAEGQFAERSLANRGSNRRQRLFTRQVCRQSATNEHDRRQNSQDELRH